MSTRLALRDGWWTIGPYILRGDNFTAANMSGEATEYARQGRLPNDWWQVLKPQQGFGLDYVVWSYWTPIAWHNGDTQVWTIPDVSYSVSTSRHQGIVRAVLGTLTVEPIQTLNDPRLRDG